MASLRWVGTCEADVVIIGEDPAAGVSAGHWPVLCELCQVPVWTHGQIEPQSIVRGPAWLRAEGPETGRPRLRGDENRA